MLQLYIPCQYHVSIYNLVKYLRIHYLQHSPTNLLQHLHFCFLVMFRFYSTERDSCLAIAECLKSEIALLVERGCKHIQIDEPLFARKTEEAMDYGIDLMSSILSTIPKDVFRLCLCSLLFD